MSTEDEMRAMSEAQLRVEFERQRIELEQLEFIFDVTQKRLGVATAAWRAAHPEREHVSPDLGALLDWLLAENDRLRAAAADFNRLRQEAQSEARILRAEVERLRATNEALMATRDADSLMLAQGGRERRALQAEVERLRASLVAAAAEVEQLQEENRQLEARRRESSEQWQKWVAAHDKVRAAGLDVVAQLAVAKVDHDRLRAVLAETPENVAAIHAKLGRSLNWNEVIATVLADQRERAGEP